MATKALVFCFGTCSNHSTFSELELVLYLLSSAVMLQLYYDLCTRPANSFAIFCAVQREKVEFKGISERCSHNFFHFSVYLREMIISHKLEKNT